MSSFFALVTPLNGFDGRPALPGHLPSYPAHPWFPGHLPSGGPGVDNSLPGGPPVHPWLPGYGGSPGIDNSLPGGPPPHPWFPGGGGHPDNSLPGGGYGGHPWLPGHGLPPFGSTQPIPPGHISVQPLPPTPAGEGNFWALSVYGWVKVPDAYKPPPNTKPEEPAVPGQPLPPTPEPK